MASLVNNGEDSVLPGANDSDTDLCDGEQLDDDFYSTLYGKVETVITVNTPPEPSKVVNGTKRFKFTPPDIIVEPKHNLTPPQGTGDPLDVGKFLSLEVQTNEPLVPPPFNAGAPVKRHKCSWCGYSAVQKTTLTQHLSTHTGEKPHKCTVCEYRAYRKNDVERHERTHFQDKPFKCSWCEFTAATKGHLTKHQSKHTGEKPYQCTTCEYRAVRKSDVIRHERKHTRVKPYKCGWCDFTAARKDYITDHEVQHQNLSPPMPRIYFEGIEFFTNNEVIQRGLAPPSPPADNVVKPVDLSPPFSKDKANEVQEVKVKLSPPPSPSTTS